MSGYGIAIGVFGFLALFAKKYAISIFDMIWGFLLIVCQKDLATSSYAEVLSLLSTMIVCVNIGYWLGVFKANTTPKTPKDTVEMTLNVKFLQMLLIASLFILSYYALRTIMRFGLDLSLIRTANNSDSADKIFTSMIDTVLFYGFAIPCIYISALAMAFNLSQGMKIPKKLIYLTVACVLMYVLARGGRTIIMRIILFFFAALLWNFHSKNREKKIKKSTILISGVLLFFGLNLITKARNTVEISFMEQLISYVQGSIAHMNVRMGEVDLSTTYYGYITYGGFLYYPVKLLQAMLGMAAETSNDIMSFLQDYTVIRVMGKEDMYNALVPNAYYYYFDSGYAGVVIFSLILGFTSGKTEYDYQTPTFFKFVLWASCVYAVSYSSLGGIFWNFGYPTALIYCFLLRKKLYQRADTRSEGGN